MSAEKPVPSESYSEEYYRQSCGGAEFFAAFGPKVPKPTLAYCLKRASLQEGMRVLDIGCGRGEILYLARRQGAFAVGTDYAEAALKLTREVSDAPVLRCDAKILPFRNGLFDRIFFVGVIDHMHDWELEKSFAEMRRVLKADGFVLVHTCTNRHYYKSLTYGLRKALVRAANALGLGLSEPSRPRSDEDEHLHVNEHSCGDLKRFFAGIGWEYEVVPIPNYKYLIGRLYGKNLPEGFPMKEPPAWKTALFMGVLFRFPLNRLLAREIFVLARPPRQVL